MRTPLKGPLGDYFGIEINDAGELCSLPLLVDECAPDLAGLPDFIVRLITEVAWDVELDCFESIARELADFYKTIEGESVPTANIPVPSAADGGGGAGTATAVGADGDGEGRGWKWTMEHRIFPAMRGMFQPSAQLSAAAAIVQIADLHQLYKVFERC
jgi:DNA mismatch repair protein MLH1